MRIGISRHCCSISTYLCYCIICTSNTAIGIAIALDKITKLMKLSEKKPSRLTEEESQNLSNELKEARYNNISEQTTAANLPQ
jgi:hypothetical protein